MQFNIHNSNLVIKYHRVLTKYFSNFRFFGNNFRVSSTIGRVGIWPRVGKVQIFWSQASTSVNCTENRNKNLLDVGWMDKLYLGILQRERNIDVFNYRSAHMFLFWKRTHILAYAIDPALSPSTVCQMLNLR